jgi:hypothetical protein
VASNVPELKNEILKVIIIIIIIKVFSYKVNTIVIIYKSKALLHFVVISVIMDFHISVESLNVMRWRIKGSEIKQPKLKPRVFNPYPANVENRVS